VSGLCWCLDDFTNSHSRRPCVVLKVPFRDFAVFYEELDRSIHRVVKANEDWHYLQNEG